MIGYLVDKSALARWSHVAVAQVLDELLDLGLLFSCDVLDMEVLYSARSVKEYRLVQADRRFAYQYVTTTITAQQQARSWQESLSVRGLHRGPGVIDILLAATAEEHNLIMLHYNADFDVIAAVSQLQTRWVVPRGTL